MAGGILKDDTPYRFNDGSSLKDSGGGNPAPAPELEPEQ